MAENSQAFEKLQRANCLLKEAYCLSLCGKRSGSTPKRTPNEGHEKDNSNETATVDDHFLEAEKLHGRYWACDIAHWLFVVLSTRAIAAFQSTRYPVTFLGTQWCEDVASQGFRFIMIGLPSVWVFCGPLGVWTSSRVWLVAQEWSREKRGVPHFGVVAAALGHSAWRSLFKGGADARAHGLQLLRLTGEWMLVKIVATIVLAATLPPSLLDWNPWAIILALGAFYLHWNPTDVVDTFYRLPQFKWLKDSAFALSAHLFFLDIRVQIINTALSIAAFFRRRLPSSIQDEEDEVRYTLVATKNGDGERVIEAHQRRLGYQAARSLDYAVVGGDEKEDPNKLDMEEPDIHGVTALDD